MGMHWRNKGYLLQYYHIYLGHSNVLLIWYRILPNKGAGSLSKVTFDIVGESWDSELSNGGFGLKIGQLLRKVCVFWTFMIDMAFPQTMGAPLLGKAPLIGRIWYLLTQPFFIYLYSGMFWLFLLLTVRECNTFLFKNYSKSSCFVFLISCFPFSFIYLSSSYLSLHSGISL